MGKTYLNWVNDYWTSRGQPLDFKHHRYLIQIYKDQSPIIDCQKSAQAGWTERMITEAMWLPDQFSENSLYLFPTAGTVSDMVQERVDDPINANPYLSAVSGRSRKILGKQADKVGMKRMSKGFVYFRGANTPPQITSVSADIIFVDELDRMEPKNVPYFDKRLEHSNRKWQRWGSTPTVPGLKINKRYLESDQHEYHIKCGRCNEQQILTFWDNIDTDKGFLICKKCKRQILPWDCEAEWIAGNPSSDGRGYHISQLYSPRLDIKKLIKESKKTAEWEIQQFYNQNLGLPYEPKGAKITETDISAAVRDYAMPTKPKEGFMGIDVGKLLHVIIRDEKRIVFVGTIEDFEDLDDLVNEYNVKTGVIDGTPETRKAQEFADRFRGRIHLCWYSKLKEPKQGEWFRVDEQKVNTDRTLSLDVMMKEIKTQEIEFPRNLDSCPDFSQHLKSLVRVIRKEKGDTIAVYVEIGEDHYAHALNYATIAKFIFKGRGTFEVFTLE